MNSDGMLRRALKALSPDYPLLDGVDPMAFIRSTWHRMRAFPGAAKAIERLRTRFTVVVLTILSLESIVGSSRAAGVQWDGILSCEFLGYYKPSLQAYGKAVHLLGLEPAEAMMVAAHEGDLAAAQAAGMRTALVRVPEADHAGAFDPPGETDFDIRAQDFDDLCRALEVS
jgi:2-haloacid dehalogenase